MELSSQVLFAADVASQRFDAIRGTRVGGWGMVAEFWCFAVSCGAEMCLSAAYFKSIEYSPSVYLKIYRRLTMVILS